MSRFQQTVTAIALAATAASVAAAGRDSISIVGSSTVYPFITVAAEQFGKKSRFPTPKVEATGTGGGLQLFCAGIGVRHPDIATASRRIKQSELDKCQANRVEVVEIKIGYDGIVLGNARGAAQYALSRRDLYLALARLVPDNGTLVENPYRTWQQVNPTLPDTEIEVLGPPPTSGTRDAFVELVMEAGCADFDTIQALDGAAREAACRAMREDGAFIEVGENDNLIVQKLMASPGTLGIFGFSFLDQNRHRVQAAAIDGVKPTFDTIADGSYPVSRPLFIYVKKNHVGTIPGIREFVAEVTGAEAAGEFGYLSERGLIPLQEDERRDNANAGSDMTVLKSL